MIIDGYQLIRWLEGRRDHFKRLKDSAERTEPVEAREYEIIADTYDGMIEHLRRKNGETRKAENG